MEPVVHQLLEPVLEVEASGRFVDGQDLHKRCRELEPRLLEASHPDENRVEEILESCLGQVQLLLTSSVDAQHPGTLRALAGLLYLAYPYDQVPDQMPGGMLDDVQVLLRLVQDDGPIEATESPGHLS